MAKFSRPEGWAFDFRGVNLRSQPDALRPPKFPMAQNIRAVSGSGVQVRPGYTSVRTGLGSLTDVRGYATLSTDDLPVYLVRSTSNAIVLSSTGGTVVTLGGTAGYGVSMIPFRPSASPQSWMYIGGVGDYQKVSAPTSGSVSVAKVGIAEPYPTTYPVPVVGAVPNAPAVQDFSGVASGWSTSVSVPGFTNAAGSLSNGNLFTDTSGVVLADPLNSARLSVAVGYPGLYLQGMELKFAGGSPLQVQEVLPACPSASFDSVRYYSGSSGNCQISVSSDISSSLSRGSMIVISGETILVLGVVTGPNGNCSIICSTSGSYSSGTLTGVACVVVYGSVSASQAITSPTVNASITGASGTPTPSVTGWISQSLSSNPFAAFGPDDYVYALLEINYIQSVSSISLLFSVGNGSPTFANSLSYSITGAALAAQAVAGELFTLSFPISAMLGSGGMPQNVNGVMLLVTMAPGSGSWPIDIGSLWVGGGSSPDVGVSGAPYSYMAVPRSSTTGAVGNPIADMRYGVTPRRQSVLLYPPSSSYDSQIDTWDIYRYGGSILSFRYIGSCAAGQSFTDNVFDDAASAGQALSTVNFEPWPTIDVPYPVSGTSVAVSGSWATLTASSYPSNILRWLPGTLVTIGGNVYTLRGRPFGSGPYTFEVEENIGYYTSALLLVNEPILARQPLPYLWGPDTTGTVFGCGDPLRPGVLYFSRANNPDSAPDANVIELCPPSEPLLGGQIQNGVSYVASSKRWWALYPSLGATTETSSGSVVVISTGTTPYEDVEIPVGVPLAAPYGHCTDSERIFFWGPDRIAATDGGPAKDLTSEDLYPIFPHEGVLGSNITRNGITYYAPDYSRAATFRLDRAGYYLYADYQDSGGTPRTLVCDLRTGAWVSDQYADPITCHYSDEQQQGSLTSTPALYPHLLMVASNGNLFTQAALANDNGTGISCLVATPEWDGGDPRAAGQFGDFYLDCLPAASGGLSVLPVSQGASIYTATSVAHSASRQFAVVTLGGAALEQFVGLQVSWLENFSTQSVSTILYLWQGSVLEQPELSKDRVEDWYDLGQASYVRGFVLRADTFGANKNIYIQSADTLAETSYTINHNGDTTLGYALATPIVSHKLRVYPADSVAWRYWGVDKWITDPWPELTVELSPWMNFGTPGAKYAEGLKIPLDTNGSQVYLNLASSDSGTPNVSLGPFITPAGKKTVVVSPIPAPFIGHEFQITPSGPCRCWWAEAELVFQPTPEQAVSWGPTQWTAFGAEGFSFIPFLDVAYSGTASVSLQVSAQDGTSPQSVTLPGTSGVYLRSRVYLTFNKGQAWQFQATSSAPFQVFLEDWVAWVGRWGRSGPLVPFRGLGGSFGDKDPI